MKIVRKKKKKQIIYETFNEHNDLLQESYVFPTSDTTYTVKTYDAKTKTLLFTNERILNAKYRDISSIFSVFEHDNGIQKLFSKSQYFNTIDDKGRLLKSEQKVIQEDVSEEFETLFTYLDVDQHDNPTIFTQQTPTGNNSFLLCVRKYFYY